VTADARSPSNWSRDATVRNGPRVDPEVLAQATRVFDRLSRRQQMEVAAEIVLTRSRELFLAYPNVVRVSYGHRRARDDANRRHRIVATPCVRFLVAGKWQDEASGNDRSRIPERLLASCWLRGKRRICAVPTDVEDAAPHLLVKAQAARIAAQWNGGSEIGTLACAVKRDILPDRVYGLGCRHVLSLSGQFFDQTTWGADVHVDAVSDPRIIGPTRALAGALATRDSFDAQLVEATNREALRDALLAPRVVNYARSAASFPGTYEIVTLTTTIPATFVDFIDARYDVNGHDVGHPNLIQSQPDTGTNPGDSGSPIVSRDGRTLLGMHVAGWAGLDPHDHFLAISYMIPAWQLFSAGNYANTSPDEVWTLVRRP
jgi:hypothetical protein